MKRLFALLLPLALLAGCEDIQAAPPATMPATNPSGMTVAEMKQKLSADAYKVLCEGATEPPFRNKFYNFKGKGTYVSAATGKPLFRSDDKFDSGTGWPSFTKPIQDGAVIVREDPDGSGRLEVIDASSGGHLGHVFDDGPTDKGGLRYCMNSAAMEFVPDDGATPATQPAK